MKTALLSALAWSFAALLCGCADGRADAERLAHGRNLSGTVIDAGPFALFTYASPTFSANAPLSVYIEGDGYAWIDRYRPSDDPTPHNPVALALAARDPAPNIVYIARPCQFVTGADRRNCSVDYWTVARFADEVVTATERAIDRYKSLSGTTTVKLYGYSGGGAIAVLVAARRQDVVALVTVAGVLDSGMWTSKAENMPLYASLEPADTAARLVGLPQLHLVGDHDKTVPAEIVQSFINRFPPGHRPAMLVVEGQDHSCCWAERWPELLKETP